MRAKLVRENLNEESSEFPFNQIYNSEKGYTRFTEKNPKDPNNPLEFRYYPVSKVLVLINNKNNSSGTIIADNIYRKGWDNVKELIMDYYENS